LYADRLKTTGVDLEPEQAISMGAFAFTRDPRRAARLAARIARERNLATADYRDVIRELTRSRCRPTGSWFLIAIASRPSRDHGAERSSACRSVALIRLRERGGVAAIAAPS